MTLKGKDQNAIFTNIAYHAMQFPNKKGNDTNQTLFLSKAWNWNVDKVWKEKMIAVLYSDLPKPMQFKAS